MKTLHPARAALGDRLSASYPAVIDGQEVVGKDSRPLVDPRTGETFATSTLCGTAEVDQAVAAARRALPDWRARSAQERNRILSAVGRNIREHAEELAALESLCNGRKLSECRLEMATAAAYFEYYGGLAAGVEGSVFESSRPNVFSAEVREPYGVTGHIVPWNSPLLLTARSVAPAIAVGNTAVIKPSDETPATAIELERLAREAGLPAGVINVVPGLGATAGAALAAHPDVPRLTFTGSTETGRAVHAAAMARMCHVTLELGGKSPHILFEDADLGPAVDSAVNAIMFASGQACVAGSRLLVAAAVYDEVVERLAEKFTALARSQDGEELIAPLISERQQRRVRDYIDKGRAEGAAVAAQGPASDEPGFYVEPTLFVDVRRDMSVFQEEIFGPVLAATRFADEKEAIALANDTTYGLAAGIWTGSIERAFRVIPRIEAGAIYVNGYLNTGIESPIGGFKASGLGHEKGRRAMLEYLRAKSFAISF